MTQRLFAVFVAGVLSVTILSGTSNAGLLLYEPFDYSGTDIATGSGGIWTDSASLNWNSLPYGTVAPVTLSGDSTSLVYPGPGGSEGARVADTGGGTALRSLGTGVSINLASDNTYYVSMLVRGSGVLHFVYGPHTNNQYYVRTALGIWSGNFAVGQNQSSAYSADYSNGTYNSDETYLLVAKIDANTSSSDEFFLKVYDSSMTPDLTEPAFFDLSATASSGVNMTYMLIGMIDNGEVDEIRVGTEWGDVISIPEPATASLLFAAIAPLALVTLRFRRRRPRGRAITA